MVTEAQKEILQEIKDSGNKPKEAKEKKEVPEGPRRYVAVPGYDLVGAPKFPFETDDPTVQAMVENSRGFNRGQVWVEMRTQEERDVTESGMAAMNITKLRSLVKALGYKNVNSYKKYELLDILMKEGFN